MLRHQEKQQQKQCRYILARIIDASGPAFRLLCRCDGTQIMGNNVVLFPVSSNMIQ